MQTLLTNLKIPGWLWAVAIIVIIALIHTYGVQYGINPVIADIIVALLLGILKGLNLGTNQLDATLKVISELLSERAAVTGTTIRGSIPPGSVVYKDEIPDKPDKFLTFLIG
jgi:hypothetical protein